MIVSISGVRSIFGVPLVLGLRVVWSPMGRRVIASSAFIIGSSLRGTDGRVVWTARFLAVMLSLTGNAADDTSMLTIAALARLA
jgi:hypothetical protein